MLNAMTVDVEDYYQVSALAPHIDRKDWDRWPSRVERNVQRLLNIFDAADVRATFFTLSWIAERYPQVVRDIVAGGHELASHGCDHTRVSAQTRAQFLADVTRSKSVLEDIGGVSVVGYRAASFSIGASTPWAHEVLQQAGYRYSSSVYPVRHDHYGSPDAPVTPYRPAGLAILEYPPSTFPVFGRNWPCAGGGYFRLLPYRVSRWCMRRAISSNATPLVFYLHPWEIDAEQPRVRGVSLKTRFRHYTNLHVFEQKFERVLGDFDWCRLDRICEAETSVRTTHDGAMHHVT